MGVDIAIALALAAAGAGVNAYNTNQTAKRQDAAAADSIRNQGRLQADADSRVAKEVEGMVGSTAADERAKRMDEFMTTLAASRKQARGIDAGTEFGSSAFQAANAERLAGADAAALRTAGQLATIDAAQLQREGEAMGYGRLATDLGLASRKSKGQAWVDELRARGIRRNAGLDILSGALTGASGAVGGLGGGGGVDAGVGPVVREPLAMPRVRGIG